MTLTEFIEARLEEDETCQHCTHPIVQHVGRWCRVRTGAINSDGADLICCCAGATSDDRVLREVAAMRAMLRELDEWVEHGEGDDVDGVAGARTIVRGRLASIWSDHEDYREEWTPRPEEWT